MTTWTPEQQAIFAQAESEQSLMIKAYAGCGKTSTIVELSKFLPKKPTLAVAFNKKIADELVKKLPSHFTVKTLNGLGHGAFASATGRRLTVDSDKSKKIFTDLLKQTGDKPNGDSWAEVMYMVRAAKQVGLVPRTSQWANKTLVEDTSDMWEVLASGALYSPTPDSIDYARAILHQSIHLAMTEGLIDFDDQIYMSTTIAGLYSKYAIVIVDEAQDLSPLNHRQLARSLGPSSRLIAVGDPKQAIYAFRGADSQSMDNLRELRSSWVDLSLTTTFRCPKAVVRRQQQHAPGFNAAPSAPDGSFTEWRGRWDIDMVRAAAGQDRVAILCRNNAPLMRMAFAFIARMEPITYLGSDIGKGLIKLVKKVCGENYDLPAISCLEKITQWSTDEIAKARAKEQGEEAIARIHDRRECLFAVVEAGQAQDLGDIISKLKFLFEESQGGTIFATGHKSKGLEWPVVIHLDPWRIPSKFAKAQKDEGNSAPLEQELNLKYVIETRSQRALITASTNFFEKDQPDVHEGM